MALQTLPNYIDFPSVPGLNNLSANGYSQNGYLLNAAGEWAAVILQVPPSFSGNITKIHFNCETAPTAGNVVLSVESVDSNGFPNGDWSTNTNVTLAAAASSGWQTGTLTSAAAISPGDLIAIKMEVDTGSSFAGYVSRAGVPTSNIEAGLVMGTYNLSGSDTKSTFPHIFAEMSDGSILAFGSYVPMTDWLSVNISTAGDGVGMKVTMPFKCRVVGMRFYIGSVAHSTGDVLFRLIDSDGSTNLESVTIEGENLVTSSNQGGYFNAFFDTAVTLAKDDVVYLVAELGSGMTDTIQFYQNVVDGGTTDEKWLDSFMSNATPVSISGGTITEEDREHWYMCALIIDQLDDGAGGGGSSGTPAHVSVV